MKGKTGKPAMRGGGLARKGMGAALKGGGMARKGTGSNATPGGKTAKMAMGGTPPGVTPMPGRMPAFPGRPGEIKKAPAGQMKAGPGEMGRGGGFGGPNIGFGMQKDMRPIGPGFGGGMTATTMPVNPLVTQRQPTGNEVAQLQGPASLTTNRPPVDFNDLRGTASLGGFGMKKGGKVAKYAKGGAVKMTAGAGSGSGRLEKVEAHKKSPRVKAVGLKKGGKVKAMADGGIPTTDNGKAPLNDYRQRTESAFSPRSEASAYDRMSSRIAQRRNAPSPYVHPDKRPTGPVLTGGPATPKAPATMKKGGKVKGK